MPTPDELLNDTINMFEAGVQHADMDAAVENVENWITFLRGDKHPAAGTIADLLEPLRDALQARDVPTILNGCQALQDPTKAQGDPSAPVGSKPKKISHLGILLGLT